MENDKDLKRTPSAENPYKLSDLKITKVEKSAGGVPAVMAAVRDLIQEKNILPGNKSFI